MNHWLWERSRRWSHTQVITDPKEKENYICLCENQLTYNWSMLKQDYDLHCKTVPSYPMSIIEIESILGFMSYTGIAPFLAALPNVSIKESPLSSKWSMLLPASTAIIGPGTITGGTIQYWKFEDLWDRLTNLPKMATIASLVNKLHPIITQNINNYYCFMFSRGNIGIRLSQ